MPTERQDLERRVLEKRVAEKRAMEAAQRPPEPQSKAGSFVSGLSQGLTLGYGDEIIGGMRAGIGALQGEGDFSDLYTKYRDEQRGHQDKMRDANPKSTFAGELVGGVGTAFLPGGAVGTGAKLGKQVAAATGLGAAAGVGYGEGESASDMAKEALVGGVLGAGSLGLTKGVGAVASPVGKVANKVGGKVVDGAKAGVRKAVAAVGGVPDEAVQKYLKNPEKYDKVKGAAELSEEIGLALESLKERVVKGSESATDMIPDDLGVDPTDAIKIIEAKIANLKKVGITNATKAEIKEYAGMKDALKKLYVQGELWDDTGRTTTRFKQPVPGKDIKGMIKRLDRETRYADRSGQFDDPLNVGKKELRASFDTNLKEAIPEYAEAMGDVAADAKALNVASKQFGKQDTATSRLKMLGNRPQDKQEVGDALGALDERMGTDFVGQNANRQTAELFEKDATRGSRNVNLWGALLGGAYSLVTGDPTGLVFSVPGGALTGAMADKYGPKATKQLLRQYVSAKKLGDKGADYLRGKTGPIGEGVKKVMDSPGTKGVTGYKVGEKYGQTLAQSPERAGNLAPFVGSVLKAKDPLTGEEKPVGADKLGDVLKSDPSRFGRYAPKLQEAAEKGPEALGSLHYILMKNDPEYRAKFSDVDK